MYCSQSNVVLLSNDEYTLHGLKFFFIKEFKIFCKVKKANYSQLVLSAGTGMCYNRLCIYN